MIDSACAFAGHRPMRFSFGYDEEDEKCIQLKKVLAEQVETLIRCGVSTFYSGMELGVDTWGADIVLKEKKQYANVRLIAVLPCETQANRWSPEQRERYFDTLAECDDVITLNTHYIPDCMFQRNRYLVDHAGYLLAVYDGGGKGGTAYTVRYAQKKNRQIVVIRPDTLEVVPKAELEALARRKRLRVLSGNKKEKNI